MGVEFNPCDICGEIYCDVGNELQQRTEEGDWICIQCITEAFPDFCEGDNKYLQERDDGEQFLKPEFYNRKEVNTVKILLK